MKYRILDSNGDMSFGNGNADFYQNIPEAVAQAVQTSLLLFLGEWYLDTTAGIPYLEAIIGKHSQDEADATLVGKIQNVQGVVSISNYQSEIDPNTRSYKTVSGTLTTIYGQTELEIENARNF